VESLALASSIYPGELGQ